MIHKNLTPFYWGPKVTSRTPPQVEMAVCVRGVFRLAPNTPLEAIEDPIEQGFMSGDVFGEDDINQEGALSHASDFADFKLNSEVLLKGSCHPPGGSGTECAVRFAVGNWSKSLNVVGPRAYQPGLVLGGKASEPQPFASMPLTWENAYGGEGYGRNPAGRGFRGEELPTVEAPGAPVKKPGGKNITPASFLPISPHWPQRLGKRGKNYGTRWKKTRAPFFSDDFDWTYFHAAPDDQQLDGYLRGDEQLTFENLHPDAAAWSTHLPGLRIRAFVKTADGKIHEPEMRLDTLFANLEDSELHLTWRGLTPIQEIDMTDVGVVLIASEDLGDEPKPAEHYIEQLGEFEADPVGLKTAFPAGFMMVADAIAAAEQAELNGTPMPDLKAVAENLPAECPFPPWFLAAAAGDEDPLGVKDQFPAGMLDGDPAMGQGDKIGGLADPETQAKLFADLDKLKEDPGLAAETLGGIVGLLPAEHQAGFEASVSALSDALASAKASGGDDVLIQAAQKAAAAPPGDNLAQGYDKMIGEASDQLTAASASPDTAAKAADAQAKLASAPQTLDAAVADALAPLDNMELPPMPEIPDAEADLAAQSAKLDVDEARMREKFGDHPMLGMFDMGRNLIANAPRPGDLAPDLSAIPAAMKNAQESLAAQGISAAAMAPLARLTAKVDALVEQVPKPDPLPEGEFVARDLRAHDFSNQDLKGAVFCKSDLTAAKFVGSDLTGADFTKADLTNADLSGATLQDATFSRATLTKAALREVKARGAIFSNAELGRADFTDADLVDAKLNSCRAEKVQLPRATLTGVDARFADLSKADLESADLTGANLSFATLDLVKADKANFTEVVFDIGKITKSRLQGAVFDGARSNMGSLTESNLTGASLRGTDFEKVDFMKAVLDQADFTNAKLRQLTLRDTTATGACFASADLGGSSATGEARFIDCDFQSSDGSRSVWMDVDLTGSNFRHARFANAFFQSAKGTDIDFTASTMKAASFRKVAFTRVSFAYADLAGTIFQDAGLDDGDFKKSNCYDAKFLGAKAVRCRFEDAFLVGVQLDDPDQKKPGELPS